MSMEIDHADSNDILILCRDCGEMSYLGDLLDKEVAHTHKYLCEANAREIYKMICALEIQALSMRKIYNKWKQHEFTKGVDDV